MGLLLIFILETFLWNWFIKLNKFLQYFLKYSLILCSCLYIHPNKLRRRLIKPVIPQSTLKHAKTNIIIAVIAGDCNKKWSLLRWECFAAASSSSCAVPIRWVSLSLGAGLPWCLCPPPSGCTHRKRLPAPDGNKHNCFRLNPWRQATISSLWECSTLPSSVALIASNTSQSVQLNEALLYGGLWCWLFSM